MPRRKHGIMPIELQIATLRKILKIANPSLGDVDVLPAGEGGHEEWIDSLDEEMTLSENIGSLEEEFPQVHWRVPKRQTVLYKRKQEVDRHAGPEGDSFSLKTEIEVRPHKVRAKGKTYLRGRIQLTVDEELIGKKAEVNIYIPRAFRSVPSDSTSSNRARTSKNPNITDWVMGD